MDKTTFQEKLWQGEYGMAYTKRSPASVKEMDKLYSQCYGFSRTELNNGFLSELPRDIKVLEVGSHLGIQLALLQEMGFEELYGIEINKEVLELSKPILKNINNLYGSVLDIPFKNDFFDLVFTSGLLIHISPNDLNKAMAEIVRSAKKYIWCFEYYAPDCQEVYHRGEKNILWKRDFARLFLKQFSNLRLLKEKKLKYLDGSENLDTVFLLEKQEGSSSTK